VKNPSGFWAKVNKTDSCWWWTGLKNRGSGAVTYGLVYVPPDRRMMAAHRVSWSMRFGEPPKGIYVLHHCDNGLCVNPDHLFLGTQKDNIMDAARKGRLGPQLKTHCNHGHEFTVGNTVMITRPDGRKYRSCRTCINDRERRSYHAKKGVACG